MLDDDLRAAEHVACGQEPHGRVADAPRLAVGRAVEGARGLRAEAGAHDRRRRGRGHHRGMARAGMIAVSVRDHGAVDRPVRIDVEIARHAVEPAAGLLQPPLRRGIPAARHLFPFRSQTLSICWLFAAETRARGCRP